MHCSFSIYWQMWMVLL